MKTKRGFVNESVLIAIILGFIVVVGGAYFVIQQRSSDRPKIILEASPLQIKVGQSSIISWHATNVSKCAFIDPENEEVASDGQKTVSPEQTTTFTLWCVHGVKNDTKGIAEQESITISVESNTSQSSNTKNTPAENPAATQTPSRFQGIFDTLSVGTTLQGRVLTAGNDNDFLDGGADIDTVNYNSLRSNYSLYRGKDLPDKDYYNTIFVFDKQKNAIDIIVNVEYLQFLDQKLSVPDFKVVSNDPSMPRITFGASKDGVNFLQNLAVSAGTPVTLKWIVNSATACVIYQGTAGEQVLAEGTKMESPAVTTSYRLWCVNTLGSGEGESSAEMTATVSVQ